jgi:hypothetical protein
LLYLIKGFLGNEWLYPVYLTQLFKLLLHLGEERNLNELRNLRVAAAPEANDLNSGWHTVENILHPRSRNHSLKVNFLERGELSKALANSAEGSIAEALWRSAELVSFCRKNN